MLSADGNIQVVQPSTPAQYFHVLRRQVLRPWRKPLVVLTPKSLLRHPRCVSSLEECSAGGFRRVIADPEVQAGEVSRVLLCSGRIYYDLVARRDQLERKDVAIVRIEQFYPLSDGVLRDALEDFRDETPVFWLQDEPVNMGAWHHLQGRFGRRLLERHPLAVIARAESSSPATGSSSAHKLEQEEILERAFAAT